MFNIKKITAEQPSVDPYRFHNRNKGKGITFI